MVIEGQYQDDEKLCKNHILDLYKELYSEKMENKPILDGVTFKQITSERSEWLESNFTGIEFKIALDSLATNKSPRPKGSNMEVYRRCWYFMKCEIIQVVGEL